MNFSKKLILVFEGASVLMEMRYLKLMGLPEEQNTRFIHAQQSAFLKAIDEIHKSGVKRTDIPQIKQIISRHIDRVMSDWNAQDGNFKEENVDRLINRLIKSLYDDWEMIPLIADLP